MNKLLLFFSFWLLISCGSDTSHDLSPIVAPVDNRTEKTKIHENTLFKTEALQLMDKVEIISTKINAGQLFYKVGAGEGLFLESTIYFTDEAKTDLQAIKMIAMNGSTDVYFISKNKQVLQQNGFSYIFDQGKLVYVMKGMETVIGISENNKKDITAKLRLAKKMATNPEIIEE